MRVERGPFIFYDLTTSGPHDAGTLTFGRRDWGVLRATGGFNGSNETDRNNGRFADKFSRFFDGSNFLFIDGHVKWLKGQSVSSGVNPTSSTTAQGPGDYGNAAGTEVAGYAATFSTL